MNLSCEPTPPPAPPTRGGVQQATLTIDLTAVAANWRALCARHGADVAGVVKADAYGLGAARVVPALAAAGCRHFFVAQLAEALAIRPLAPDAEIAVFAGPAAAEPAAYLANAITPVLNSLAQVAAWNGAGPAWLHVDTGMSRLGLDARELATVQADIRSPAAILRGVMTHLVAAEVPDDPLNARQYARFAAACGHLPPVPRSLANSSGIFLGFGSDLARPGAALYGINPTPGRPNPMRPVVALHAPVLALRDIAPGETVGYNATWTATRPSRIATVGVGYADGWLRAQSNRGFACFDGAPVPLVGRVSMDLATYDVTDHPGLAVGSLLELIGPNVPVERVAEAAGTNAYEILTALGRRYARTTIA